MTKTLLLPAEILSRELDARLLQGVLGLERGWRVILGSKALMNRAIWRLPRGLYLCQTLTHKRLPVLKLLERLGHVSVGWDEEGLIYLDRDVYMMRRVSSETLARLSGLIAWGPQSAEDLGPRAAAANLTPKAFGNPRFDLLRPELHGLYAAEVDAIRREHGDFVLFNTSFSSCNPVVSLHDQQTRAISEKDRPADGATNRRFRDWTDHRKRLFDAFLVDMPELARRNPDLNFVVRPHPSENAATWSAAFENLVNVKVVREGASIPWLMAARALVHNNCMTAAEAAVMGHAPVAYCPETILELESALPNPVSRRTANVEELSAAVRLAFEGRLTLGDAQRATLDRFISGITGPLASSEILDYCDAIYAAAAPAKRLAALPAIRARIDGAWRHYRKSSRKDHLTDRYLAKVFPPTPASEVAARATKIARTLGLAAPIAAREISKNIFELSAANR